MSMPAATSRLHLMPYWLGDSPHAIDVAAGMAIGSDGGRYTDTNIQKTLDGAVCMHWGTAGANGYNYIERADGSGRRLLTESESDRRLTQWRTADIRRMRRTARPGETYESQVRPWGYYELVYYAAHRGVTVIGELKSPAFGTLAAATQLVSWAHQAGVRPWFMTLVCMINWRAKVKEVFNAHGEIALLSHGHPMPADFADYKQYISQVWDANWLGR